MAWIGEQKLFQLLCGIVTLMQSRQPTERGYVMTIIHFFQTRHSVLD